LDIAGELM